ncbi:OmpA family protein [Bosea sp. (in: a-proteobacteria)]|uniref:OmpA family protein n=1 Tax=Bosea sp. (in: a-proteobacteria) TaxID=1871050 RepID=UPI0026212BF4|nr:OmpA family protein [Bosea sp. (in: a-proteobacteria)]MCO5090897.1 OmpA family protein [Bosea sp. (in: a-proteobacteria)]
MNRSILCVLVLAMFGFMTSMVAGQSVADGSLPPPPEDLFAFSAGARFVQKPADADYADMAYTPYALIDETPSSETRAEGGKPATYVLELPEKTELSLIAFDSAGMGIPEKSVRRLTVEISDTAPDRDFRPVLEVELAMDRNDQRFELVKKPVGRWVRLTFLSNHGAENYGMTGFRGYGRRLTETAGIENVSGTYEGASGWGRVRLKQEGTRVVGCFEYRSGLIAAGVEGRLLKGEMIEHEDDGSVSRRSLALFAFAPGNKSLFALSRSTESNPDYGYDAFWSATKQSNDIGDCPAIKGWRTAAARSQLEETLQSSGRARLDGINFEFNSATIQPASFGLLDQVADMLHSRKDWRIRLEGHTDSIGSASFNKDLSMRRAVAVRSYLAAKGVDSQRLGANGFGSGNPVASNETQGGRAQNRRVEIVRE